MKFFRAIGIKCPVCGQQQLCVTDFKVKDQVRYVVSCSPHQEEGSDDAVVCPHGTWGEGAGESLALRAALHGMVQEIDTNMKARSEQRDHIVETLFKQLQQQVR